MGNVRKKENAYGFYEYTLEKRKIFMASMSTRKKKRIKIIAIALIVCMLFPVSVRNAEAADVVISCSQLTLKKGAGYKLKLYNIPKGAKVKWSSNNYFTASVSKKGKVKALNYGTSTVTAKYKKKYYTCLVTVPDSSRSVTLNMTTASLIEGQSVQLAAESVKKVTYISSNSDIASVDRTSGLVTAKNPGTATITAKSARGFAQCTVYVGSSDYQIQSTVDLKNQTIFRCTAKNKIVREYISWAKGKTLRLIIANVDSSTVKKVVWKSGNKTILTTPKAESGNKIVASANTLKEGTTQVTAKVTFYNGSVREYTVPVSVSDPKISAKDITVFKSGNYAAQWQRYLSFDGLNVYSKITLGEYDAGSIYTSVYHSKIAVSGVKAGSGTMKLTVDGKNFTVTYHVYEPQIYSTPPVIKVNALKKFQIYGMTGITPKYASRNRTIATVAADGTVQTKKAGVTYIDVSFGNVTCAYRLEVAPKGVMKIIKRCNFILQNWKYSQKKRLKKGFYDCSALVWKGYKVYKKYHRKISNINTPLSAGGMFDYLNSKEKIVYYGYVGTDQLKPGDLIFYGDYEGAVMYSTPGRTLNIYHVSLYAGNGVIVEKEGQVLNYNRIKDIVGIGRVIK